MSQEHPHRREVRVVVVGGNRSGKTSLINTVLGQQEPEHGGRTTTCMRREGEVDGRKLIFIDTPSWWRNYLLIDTSEFIKQELVLSVFKCPPGPNAFILVISTDVPFTEKDRRSVEEHLGLFGEKVWEHTIVVITGKDRSKEEHRESECLALGWVTDKCPNRYHVFENKSMTEPQQIAQLLEKIECVIAKNCGSFFQLEKAIREVEEKRKLNGEKAESRRQRVKGQRETLSKQAQLPPLFALRMLLIGWVCSGKTTAKNIILNINEIIGRRRTIQTDSTSGEVSGRKITLVDTPGWWKYFSAQFTPDWVQTELRRSVTLDGQNPHAILLAIPADTAFREEQRKITEGNMRMFGEQVWRHTMVLFTSGDLLGEATIEEHIESEGEPLRWLVEKCGNRYHVLGKDESGESSQVPELLEKIEEMVAGNSLFSFNEETQTPDVEEMNAEPDETNADMVKFLDQEWNRMDKDMEETLRNILTFALKGDESMHDPPQFHDNKTSSDTSMEERLTTKCTSPPPTHQSTSESGGKAELATGQAEAEVPQEKKKYKSPEDLMEKMREKLEREWGRREVTVTERFLGVMSSGLSSEPDEHAHELATRKVLRWFDGTSGHGTDEELNTVENE